MVEFEARASREEPMGSWPRVQMSNEERGVAVLNVRTNLPKFRRIAALTSYSDGFAGVAGVAAGVCVRSTAAVSARAAVSVNIECRRQVRLDCNCSVGDPGCMRSLPRISNSIRALHRLRA